MVCRKNFIITMFTIIKNVIDDNLSDKIVSSLRKKNFFTENTRHFNLKGKNFFQNLNGVFFLSQIINQLDKKSELLFFFKNHVVDHAYVLIKSPSSKKTPFHQDIPFWTGKEIYDPVTFVTIWFALEDIKKNKGALILERSKEVSELNLLNTNNRIYEHIHTQTNNGFDYIIPEDLIEKNKFKIYSVPKNSCVIFDAYSIHASTKNNSGDYRKSFKIVLRKNNRGLADRLRNITLLKKFPLIYFLIQVSIRFMNSIRSLF